MKKSQPETITLNEFIGKLSAEQTRIVDEEIQYYRLLTKFKEARESKGLSQEELANKANINRTTLSKIESGLRNATIDSMMKLARALDMNLELRLH